MPAFIFLSISDRPRFFCYFLLWYAHLWSWCGADPLDRKAKDVFRPQGRRLSWTADTKQKDGVSARRCMREASRNADFLHNCYLNTRKKCINLWTLHCVQEKYKQNTYENDQGNIGGALRRSEMQNHHPPPPGLGVPELRRAWRAG